MKALLEVDNLKKSFGATEAVAGIHFSIQAGRCVALLGPNGAGKTTTLKMLAGLLTPTDGVICFDGVHVPDIRPYMGYLPQNPGFHEWMTGKEFLVYAGQLAGLSKSKARTRSDAVISQLGLKSVANRSIHGYSGGMKQRLGICQALIHQPRLLILDEPVSALDPVGRRDVLELLADLRGETTVLYSTHVLHDAEEISDDIILIVEGDVVLSGELEEVKRSQRQPKIELTATCSLEPYHHMLSSLPGVREVTGRGMNVSIMVQDLEAIRNQVLRVVAEQQIPVDRMEFGHSTLEDLFMEAVKA